MSKIATSTENGKGACIRTFLSIDLDRWDLEGYLDIYFSGDDVKEARELIRTVRQGRRQLDAMIHAFPDKEVAYRRQHGAAVRKICIKLLMLLTKHFSSCEDCFEICKSKAFMMDACDRCNFT